MKNFISGCHGNYQINQLLYFFICLLVWNITFQIGALEDAPIIATMFIDVINNCYNTWSFICLASSPPLDQSDKKFSRGNFRFHHTIDHLIQNCSIEKDHCSLPSRITNVLGQLKRLFWMSKIYVGPIIGKEHAKCHDRTLVQSRFKYIQSTAKFTRRFSWIVWCTVYSMFSRYIQMRNGSIR